MTINNKPVFPRAPNNGVFNVVLTTGNTTKDGSSGVTLVFTASADGSYVDGLQLKAKGTNVASLLRVFLNDGSGTAAANMTLLEEMPLPSTTNSETIGTPTLFLPLDIDLKASQRIYVVLATTVSAGWGVTARGWDYGA